MNHALIFLLNIMFIAVGVIIWVAVADRVRGKDQVRMTLSEYVILLIVLIVFILIGETFGWFPLESPP